MQPKLASFVIKLWNLVLPFFSLSRKYQGVPLTSRCTVV